MEDRPFALVGVNLYDKRHRIRRYVDENRIDWRSFYMGDENHVVEAYEVDVFPTSITLDADGVIAHRGARPPQNLVEGLVRRAESRGAIAPACPTE